MKKLLLILCIASLSHLSHEQDEMDALKNLVGTWVMNAGDTRIYEVWRTDGSQLSGYSFKVFRGDTTYLEKIVIEKTESGIYYKPTVPNQNDGKQISFKLEKKDNNSYYFINLQHDFPKRIIYKWKENNELEVIIDDAVEITKKRQVYMFKRVPG